MSFVKHVPHVVDPTHIPRRDVALEKVCKREHEVHISHIACVPEREICRKIRHTIEETVHVRDMADVPCGYVPIRGCGERFVRCPR